MNVGSLFSGIGGLDLGLERAGLNIAWQAESDAFCRGILARHWPDVPNHGDVRAVDWAGVDRPDLVAGGFPCQPSSVAGGRRGRGDERWLWPEFARAVRCLRPRWVLVENVPGLLSVNGGAAAEEVFGDLATLGFDAEWACIPAAAVGAPHLRYRLFVVAHANGQGLEGPRVLHRTDEDAGALPTDGDWWRTEPGFPRVAHGIPGRVDRIRAVGNAVVPQVAEWIGRRIMSAHSDGSPCPECNGEKVIRNEWTGEVDRCPSCTLIDGDVAR